MNKAYGRSKVVVTGRILHADGTVTNLGELRSTWRSWPIIRNIRKYCMMLALRRRSRRRKWQLP